MPTCGRRSIHSPQGSSQRAGIVKKTDAEVPARDCTHSERKRAHALSSPIRRTRVAEPVPRRWRRGTRDDTARSRPGWRTARGSGGTASLGPLRLGPRGARSHYLTLDYLAEVTMSIMQKLKSRNPDGRLRHRLRRRWSGAHPANLPRARASSILANAGGRQPRAPAWKSRPRHHPVTSASEAASAIGIVEGDDILADLPRPAGVRTEELFANMDSGAAARRAILGKVTRAPTSTSAPSPGGPRRWQQGADIVITGRCHRSRPWWSRR